MNDFFQNCLTNLRSHPNPDTPITSGPTLLGLIPRTQKTSEKPTGRVQEKQHGQEKGTGGKCII